MTIQTDRERQNRLRDVFQSHYEYAQESGNKLLALIAGHKPPFPIYHDTAGLFSSILPIFKLAEESADAALAAFDVIDTVLALHPESAGFMEPPGYGLVPDPNDDDVFGCDTCMTIGPCPTRLAITGPGDALSQVVEPVVPE